jgi:hypothetical protein
MTIHDKPTLMKFLIEQGFIPETTTKAIIEIEAGKLPIIQAQYYISEVDGVSTDKENPCGCKDKKK